MTYSHEVEHMCVVKKGPNHGPAPIPEEGKWVKSKEIVDISGLTHGVGRSMARLTRNRLPVMANTTLSFVPYAGFIPV